MKRFPILKNDHDISIRKTWLSGWPLTIPWEIIELHKAQAEKNHGQTIERLAERGGLCPQELYAVLNNMTWQEVEKEYGDKPKAEKLFIFMTYIKYEIIKLETWKDMDNPCTHTRSIAPPMTKEGFKASLRYLARQEKLLMDITQAFIAESPFNKLSEEINNYICEHGTTAISLLVSEKTMNIIAKDVTQDFRAEIKISKYVPDDKAFIFPTRYLYPGNSPNKNYLPPEISINKLMEIWLTQKKERTRIKDAES